MAHATQNALGLTTTAVDKLRGRLPEVAAATVAAVVTEVPAYASALDGPMGASIEKAVQMALGAFLKLAARSQESDPGVPLQPALDAAYALGRGEAQDGRSMDALQAAYRVGARVAWRELSGTAIAADLPITTMAQFAELVFAYIDELSAASVSGHSDELASSDRARHRHRDRLARALLDGEPADVLHAAAERAQWPPPDRLAAVLLAGTQLRGLGSLLDGRALVLSDGLPGFATDDDCTVLLLPIGLAAGARDRLLASLAGRQAVVGPARPWHEAKDSYARAVRARHLIPTGAGNDIIDTDRHLVELVIGADAAALADLRSQVLAPLANLRGAAVEKLTETLRAWVQHQGRRDDMAAALFVHAQTVRYRVGQLRELYGERLDDPRLLLEAMIALA